jgi:hypothetical protein
MTADSVQGGRRFSNVFANDRHVADLAVALSQVEMGEADGARIVGDFRLFQGAVVERNGPGLFATRERDAPMQPPEIRVQNLRQILAKRVGRPAQHRSGLCKIPLQEVRFSQHDADAELVFLG